jgi:RNA-directed DNA polymerase
MCQELTKTPSELCDEFYRLVSIEDIANLLDINTSQLKYYLYVSKPHTNYTNFFISKRSGGRREICAPVSALKCIQKKLAQVLQAVYEPKAPAHGYVLEKSIVTNAKIHTRKRYVLNIDLKDFFPSIEFMRVRSKFMTTPYNRNSTIATILAQICCHQGSLPQGAPTSPIVSNIVCAKMDSQLRRFAVQHKCAYTRYADDITFSTSLPVFPTEVAYLEPQPSGIQLIIGDGLKSIIKDNDFEINEQKCRLQPNYRRQEVTGLTVNKTTNVNRKYIRQVRAILHDWEVNKLKLAEIHYWEKNASNHGPFKNQPSLPQIMKGKIDFIGMVRGKDNPYYLSFLKQLAVLSPISVNKTPKEIGDELNHAIKRKLQTILEGNFNLDELRKLCFHLDVDFENLDGGNKSVKTISLVDHMFMHGRLKELEKEVRKERPQAFE